MSYKTNKFPNEDWETKFYSKKDHTFQNLMKKLSNDHNPDDLESEDYYPEDPTTIDELMDDDSADIQEPEQEDI